MTEKIIRPGVYGIVSYENKIILTKKNRGPFIGMYDLPGGGIEHGEEHAIGLKREIKEELGINSIGNIKLVGVFDHFVEHEWKGKYYSSHLIGIVYSCNTNQLPNMELIEKEDNDTSEYILINLDEIKKYDITPIGKMAFNSYINFINNQIL